MIAAVCKVRENAREFTNLNVGEALFQIFKFSKEIEHANRYISVLNIIQNSARSHSDTAILFLNAKETKESLIQEIIYEINVNKIIGTLILK